jgi:DHA1 family bicyclomycin/chloramphenicol resistance-like MFS transporter
MTSSFLRAALILGLLSAIGPFAIDMYLPALPAIGASLGASTSAAQGSLMAFFIALGVGQIIYGPVSDQLGRKPPLYFGLALFAVGSVGCALAPDIHTLVAMRFVQGLGACAGSVVPRAVVRDLYTGHQALRLMSMLMLVFSVSPILAPLAGSLLTEALGWRSAFWFMLGAGLLGLGLVATQLDETRPAAERAASSWGQALRGYAKLLRDRHFLGLTFIGAFGISSFFAYLANSSFVLIEHYGLTPRQYSVVFASNAASFIGMSQLTARLGKRFGLKPMVRVAAHGYAGVMALLLGLFLAGVNALPVLLVLLFVGYGFLGLIIPTSAILALEEHGPIAGTASALMGTLQFATGAVVMTVTGLFVDGTALPMVAGIAGSSLLCWALVRGTLGAARSRA